MNDTETVDRLRAQLADRHLERPVEQVMARGRALRRRRRRPAVVVAVVALAAGAATATATLGAPSPAYADWSATPEATPPDVAAAIDASCRRDLERPTATLALIDRRGANAVAVYTSSVGDYQCTRFQGSEGPDSASWWTQGGAAGPTKPAHPDTVIEVTNSTAGSNVHEGSMTALSGRVQPDVARVTVALGSRVVVGVVDQGAFDVWWPAVGAGDAPVTLTAHAADGSVMSTLTSVVPGFGQG